jgi:hypothetical protein
MIHFGNAFETNLKLILGGVGLGRSLETNLGLVLGGGRFGLNSRVISYQKACFKVGIYNMHET